jgi:hypothetical protein
VFLFSSKLGFSIPKEQAGWAWPSMQKKKKNHFVPQSYLRPFAADAKREKIWVLSKADGPAILKPIEKVAVRFYLYTPANEKGIRDYAFEDKLASLEQMFGLAGWGAISAGYVDLSTETMRKSLGLLTAVMILRNPRNFEDWQTLHKRQVSFYAGLPSLPDTIEMKGKVYEIDKDSWPAFRDASPDDVKRMWLEQVGSGVWLAEILMKMRWGMFASETPAFITTDNPVAISHPSLHNMGLSNPDTIVTFPLSPTRVLFMDNRHTEPDNQYYESGDVGELNGVHWRNALSNMFSHRDPIEVCAEMLASAEKAGSA